MRNIKAQGFICVCLIINVETKTDEVLALLKEKQDISLDELMAETGLDRTDLLAILRPLENSGLVIRYFRFGNERVRYMEKVEPLPSEIIYERMEIERLKAKAEALRDQYRSAVDGFEEFLSQLEEQRKNIAEIQKILGVLPNLLNEYKKRLEETKEFMARLKKQQESLNAEVEKLRGIDEMRARILKLLNEKKELEKRLKTIDTENLQKALIKLEGIEAAMKQAVEETKAGRSAELEEIDQMIKEVEGRMASLEQWKGRLSNAEAAPAASQQLKKLAGRLGRLEREVKAIAKEIETRKQRLDYLKKKYGLTDMED